MGLMLGRRPAEGRRDLRLIEKQGLDLRAQDPARALECFDRVLVQDPDRVVSLRAAGRLLMKSRQGEDARPMWERLARLDRTDPEPHVQLARIHRQSGREAEADAEVRQALALAPHHAAAAALKASLESRRHAELPVADVAPPWSRLRRWLSEKAAAFGWRQARLPRLKFSPRPAAAQRAPLESPATRLLAQATRQADAGDREGLLLSLDLLLQLVGPTSQVTALMRRQRQLVVEAAPAPARSLDAAGSDRATSARLLEQAKRQADDGDRAGLLQSIDLLLAMRGPTPEISALVRRHRQLAAKAGPVRRRDAEGPDGATSARLLEQAKRQADDGDRAGLLQSIDLLLAMRGPTPEISALVRRHRQLAVKAGPGRLAPERATSETADAATSARLLAQADRQAEAGDRAGLLLSLNLLLELDGPTPRITALMRRQRQLAAEAAPRATRRFAEGPDPAVTERLLDQANRQADTRDRAGLMESIDLLLAQTGATPEISALVRRHRRLAKKAALTSPAFPVSEGVDDSIALRLLAQAGRQADAGDHDGLMLSLDLLLDLIGPTPQVTALMRRQGQIEDAADGRGAGRQSGDLRLIQQAREQAQAGLTADFVSTIETIVGLSGPSPELATLISEYRAMIEQAGARRLLMLVELSRAGPAAGARGVSGGGRDQEADPVLQQLGSDIQRGDVGPVSRDLELLARLATYDDRARGAVERHASWILERLSAQRATMSGRMLTAVEKRLIGIYAREPWVRQALARQRETAGESKQALRLYQDMADNEGGAAPALFHAATLAGALGDWPQAMGFARRAIAAAPDDRALVGGVAALFAERGRAEDAEACWRQADDAGPLRMWVRLGLVRLLETAKDQRPVADEALRTLRSVDLDRLSVAEQHYLIDIVRRLVQAQGRSVADLGLVEACANLDRNAPPSALRDWITASFDMARFDHQAALRRLDLALAGPTPGDGVMLDLHAEKALIYARHHLYGEALDELKQASGEVLRVNGHYGRRFELVNAVAALCPDAAVPLRYPECLIDVVLEETAARPMGYAPSARHLTMISGSLGQGGGERQTITVVRRILKDSRVRKLSLLVRSTHMRPNDDFFLDDARALPLDLTIYGADWLKRTNLAEALPEFADRPRLLAALDLMPHNLREEVTRLVRLLLDQKPQAVHIWQDIYQAALACVIVGVPHFFVHRGSLAPNYWAQNEYQTAVHFRPMRHTYRRLLERPDFVIANNSISGCETDRNWLGWPDPAPFQVVYNAVDFSQLGVHTGRNFDLRREIGVPDDVNLVGGSFRIMPVKRPMYWIEAARRIREAVPGTHFLIIGDGDMTDEVAAYAAEHGFSDALHLPGRVSNVGDWYRAMDVKLLTSEREGIPNALIEAQHFGVPIIATAVGGIHEAIDIGKTGYVVSGDEGPGVYADKMIEVLLDRDWHDRARLLAPDFVHDKFSLDRVLDRLMAYYGIDATVDG